MAAGATIDLSRLPAPAVVDILDPEAALADYKAQLLVTDPTLAAVLALESEPMVKLLETAAYRDTVLRNRLNTATKACMLAFARGTNLDALVANFGVVRGDGELDDALLARALLEIDGAATAGPIKAYQSHARDASPDVSDVAVGSPAPGQVRVAILTAEGAAGADLLATVLAALDDEDVRPLTDQVTVVSAATTPYDVTATIFVASGPDSSTVEAAAAFAVRAYAARQRRLGAKISRNALIAALMQPGAVDCSLTAPAADIAGADEAAPVLGALTLAVVVDADD